MASELTPCSALFSAMKKLGGISYKELASLILSGRPLSDGRSPVSRVHDRTWVSRFVVHAPVGTLQEQYFCDFGVSALRIVARLKAHEGKRLDNDQIISLVRATDKHRMEEALAGCHQSTTLYRNTLERIIDEPGYSPDEHAEAAMVLFVATGCLGDVRRAVAYATEYTRTIHGGHLTTPAAGPATPGMRGEPEVAPVLGLLRIVDGYAAGAPHWLSPAEEGTVLGALALSDGAINDVGSHASGTHARIWRAADGRWMVEDLGSTNGTTLISGIDRAEVAVAAPGSTGIAAPREIRPGDELRLADDTAFMVLEGLPLRG